MRPAILSFWKSRIAAFGTKGRLPRRCRWSRRRFAPARSLRSASGNLGRALSGCAGRRYGLASGPPALRSSRAPAPLTRRGAEPGGGGCQGGRPSAGAALVHALAATGDLDSYHLLHATRADLLRRTGSAAEAASSYAPVLEWATNESERRFLEWRPAARFNRRKRDWPLPHFLGTSILETQPCRKSPPTRPRCAVKWP